MKAAFVLAAALVAGASAFSITMLNDEPETNVCNMNWCEERACHLYPRRARAPGA